MALSDTELKEYLQLAVEARNSSHCPYSEHQCGALILSDKGAHKGCVVENSAFPCTSCATSNALGAAISEGATEIKHCIIMGPTQGVFANPCGNCRQALAEFGDVPIYLGRSKDDGSADTSFKTSSVSTKMHGLDNINSTPFCEKKFNLENCKTSKEMKSRYVWKTEGKIDELCVAAMDAAQNAYVPYSGFPVGAAVMTEKGVYAGCNAENRFLGAGTCAECVAISKAILGGSKKFKGMAIVAVKSEIPAMPCGRCRQVMVEFGDFPVYPMKLNFKDSTYEIGSEEKVTSMSLLPGAFTAKDLKTITPLTTAGSSKTSPNKSPQSQSKSSTVATA